MMAGWWPPGAAAAAALVAGITVCLLVAWWRHSHLAMLSRWSAASHHRGRRTSRARAVMLVMAAICLTASVFEAEHGVRADTSNGRPPVLFLLDASRSMDVTDLTPSRRTAAIAIVRRLVSAPATMHSGLMVFAGDAVLACPFTTDQRAVQMALDDLPNSIATLQGGSALDLALAEALRAILRVGGRGSVVLLSDGESTTGELDEVTALAASARVAIHTVGMGTAEGGMMSVRRAPPDGASASPERRLSKLNESGLRALADATGGRYVTAEVDEAAREIEALILGLGGESARVSQWRIEWLLLAMALVALSTELALRRVPVWA